MLATDPRGTLYSLRKDRADWSPRERADRQRWARSRAAHLTTKLADPGLSAESLDRLISEATSLCSEMEN